MTTKSKTKQRIVVLAGDHVGREVTAASLRVFDAVAGLRANKHNIEFELVHGLVGGAAIDATGGIQHDYMYSIV